LSSTGENNQLNILTQESIHSLDKKKGAVKGVKGALRDDFLDSILLRVHRSIHGCCAYSLINENVKVVCLASIGDAKINEKDEGE
jgi:hypothetical protein